MPTIKKYLKISPDDHGKFLLEKNQKKIKKIMLILKNKDYLLVFAQVFTNKNVFSQFFRPPLN